jgi:hypothetical protein
MRCEGALFDVAQQQYKNVFISILQKKKTRTTIQFMNKS